MAIKIVANPPAVFQALLEGGRMKPTGGLVKTARVFAAAYRIPNAVQLERANGALNNMTGVPLSGRSRQEKRVEKLIEKLEWRSIEVW